MALYNLDICQRSVQSARGDRVGSILAEYCISHNLIFNRVLYRLLEGIVSDTTLLNILFLIHLILDRVLNSLIEELVSGLSLLNIVFLINLTFDRVLYI